MMKNMEWGAVAYLSHSKYGINEEIYTNNSVTPAIKTGRSGGNVVGSTSSYPSNIIIKCGFYTYDGKIVSPDCTIGEYASDRTLGTKASTTGNIYGVYDMNGGSREFVMANMIWPTGEFYASKSGFSTPPDSLYYDLYSYDSSSTSYSRGKLGDATKEILKKFGSTSGGWYDSWVTYMSGVGNWLGRDSVFSFVAVDGSSGSLDSTRAVICAD